MKKTIAVFDIDRTVLKGTSAERILIGFLKEKGVLTFAHKLNYAKRLLKIYPQNRVMAVKGNKYYLKGMDRDRFDELAKECFEKEIVLRISEEAVKKIEEHRAEGREIVLLSGTLNILMSFFHEHLKADKSLCSDMEVMEGKYTGDIIGRFPYGGTKADIIRMNYHGEEYDFSASYAYADHKTDLEFLRIFGHAYIVNPDPKLEAKAKKMGIGVENF